MARAGDVVKDKLGRRYGEAGLEGDAGRRKVDLDLRLDWSCKRREEEGLATKVR